MRSSESGRVAWAAVVVVAVLAAGVAVALWKTRTPTAPAPIVPAPAPVALTDSAPEPPADAIERALALAGDSTAIKTRWMDDIKELDLASLTPSQRDLFLRIANTRHCTCGCGYTLAGCRAYDSSCETSGPLVRALYDSVRAGWLHETKGLRSRPAG